MDETHRGEKPLRRGGASPVYRTPGNTRCLAGENAVSGGENAGSEPEMTLPPAPPAGHGDAVRVIVMGSGVAGAATAYHLARRGAETIVIEGSEAGAATGAGAGIVSPWTGGFTDERLAFPASAAAYYRTLVDELAEDGEPRSSFEVVGGMVVSAEDAELADVADRLRARSEKWPEIGEVSRLDAADARALFPVLAPELGAVHITGAGRVDGRTLREALLRAARRHGARTVRGTAELAPRGGRVRGVVVGDERFDADAVVVAAGAWTSRVLEPLGAEVPVTPQRGQISHFALPGSDTTAWPVVLPLSGHYLLAFPGSHVVAGATREAEAGFDHRVTAAGQREVLDEALRAAPGLADATLTETRVGFRPATPDGSAVVGALDGHPEVTLVTGFGPGGLTEAPYAARLAAESLLGESAESAPVELAALRPGRFTA